MEATAGESQTPTAVGHGAVATSEPIAVADWITPRSGGPTIGFPAAGEVTPAINVPINAAAAALWCAKVPFTHLYSLIECSPMHMSGRPAPPAYSEAPDLCGAEATHALHAPTETKPFYLVHRFVA